MESENSQESVQMDNCEITEYPETLEEKYFQIKQRIYLFSKDGFSLNLASLLNSIENESIRNVLINQEYIEEDGQIMTPIVAAARYGREKVVKLLLSNYKIDLDKKCVVKFDGHIVHGCTALWCAAGSGHLSVIKLLVAKGANINHLTDTNSSPLRAACFDGRLDIVEYLVSHNANINLANTYNNTCLMISSYKGHTDVVEFLLKNGAYVNEQAKCGATALHYASECGHLDICRLLLDHGAILKCNEYYMTPVITAAERTKESVVQLFCERENLLTKDQIIEAYELIGASFANDKDNYSLQKAFQYLHLAMCMRYEDLDNIVKKELNKPIPAYDNWIECQSLQDLVAIQYNHNSLHMESLTIRERILGRKCPEVAHSIVFRGAVCADNGRFDRCESLWLHALELRQENNLSVQRDLLRFAQVFSQMIHLNEELRIHNVIKVLKACVMELRRNKERFMNPTPKDDIEIIIEEYETNIFTSLYLITIITKLLKNKNTEIQHEDLLELYKMIYTLNKMDLKLRDGQTLLHLAVNGISPVDDFHTSDVCKFPCIDTVKLLLHCGASIYVFDCERNTPLHTLASTFQIYRPASNEMLAMVEDICKLFIAAGVHLDAVNCENLTAAQVCTSQIFESFIKRHEVLETTLQCLASRVIAQHKIEYQHNADMPKHLEYFIQLHSAEKL